MKTEKFLTTRDVGCVHHGWHGKHRYDIQVLATHASTRVQRYSSLLQWSVPKGYMCTYICIYYIIYYIILCGIHGFSSVEGQSMYFIFSSRTAFPKLWSADHRWSSGSALVVLLDWTLVQKRQEKNKINVNFVSHTVVENLKQFAFKGDKSRVVRRTFWLIKVVPTWKKFGKRWSRTILWKEFLHTFPHSTSTFDSLSFY
jgi:hypothetical protein